MPPLQVSNAALVTLRFFAGTRTWANVLGASVVPTTTIDQALANTLGTAIKASFVTNYGPQFTATGGLISVGIRDIRQPNLPEFRSASTVQPGTGAGDVLPGSNAFVVTLRTARAGQSFRGRVYLAGYTEASNDANGVALAAVGTQAVAFITAVSTTLSSNGLALAVVSRPAERQVIETTTFHADGTTDVETDTRDARVGQVTPVTTIEARNASWDSQRRRATVGSAGTLFGPLAMAEI